MWLEIKREFNRPELDFQLAHKVKRPERLLGKRKAHNGEQSGWKEHAGLGLSME